MASKPIIVRFPPSPTGLLHVGGVRTALYNYLFAKQNGGKFLLRIEDTDKERSKKEYEEDIIDSLNWLGLDWDNKGSEWRQSDRTEIYRGKIQELIQKGAAYIAELQEGETDEDKRVVRFKNPGGKIKFQDLIRGEVEMEVGDLNDFIIAKNIEEPLYHLVVVVDDMESRVTHVIRGEDGISNTPRQILILEALGGARPIYAHLPLVLAEDKSKLSKRKHGEAVSLKYYRDRGYSPEAILNFVALIGWNPGTDQEVFTLDELVKVFDLSKVQKKGGVFDIKKLDWVSREHLLKESKNGKMEKLGEQIQKTKYKDSEKWGDYGFLDKFLDIILDRIHRWGEVSEVLEAGEYDYLFIDPVLDRGLIAWKKSSPEKAKENLEKIIEIIDSKVNDKRLEIETLAGERGKGDVLWPLRYSLSGKEKSPDPFTLLDILGVEESKKRIKAVIEILN
ncbi:MAG TPA: glutamate--tRNA ligase family protein [Candidatus Paceibacterota bacterium]